MSFFKVFKLRIIKSTSLRSSIFNNRNNDLRIIPQVGYSTLQYIATTQYDKGYKCFSTIKTDISYPSSITNDNYKYAERSHNCGELRSSHIGKNVFLYGWLEFQRMNKFIVLRDGYGQTQVIIPDEKEDIKNMITKLPYESVIHVEGLVTARPENMINHKQATGEIEVVAKNIKLLNRTEIKLPFSIREFQKAKESLRMQFRYLDFRFPEMQRNLRLRSRMLMDMRDFLVNSCNFVDVETPTLFGNTPGGAQEFVVPTRFPGQFYSLVQSPQQFKQLLMVGGIDRYFQIARCYRDESARSDRQPEFTQLDLEMSFTTIEGILTLIEELLKISWPTHLKPLSIPFLKMSYADALENYGSDKPDLRYDYQLRNCTESLKSNSSIVQCDNFGAYYICFKNLNKLPNSVKDNFNILSKKFPKAKLIQTKIEDKQSWMNNLNKIFSEEVATNLADSMEIHTDSTLFLSFGDKKQVLQLLGNIRTQYIEYLEKNGFTLKKDEYIFTWIVDFPLFEINEVGNLVSVHHPFTAPKETDEHLLNKDPLAVLSQAYDLVLNGNEIGGGSIRIHSPKMQQQIFDILNIKTESMKYFVEALSSGCPPHGGIALGIDRLMAVILNCKSIRDVIAFPKGFEGRDPLSGAPLPISQSDKKLYHIEVAET